MVKMGEIGSAGRRWWGAAKVVPARPVIQYYVRSHRTLVDPFTMFGIDPVTYGSWVSYCNEAVINGCWSGVEKTIDRYLVRVPSKSGALRRDVAWSLRQGAWFAQYARSLPATIYLGAPNTKYAPVVHRYKKALIQLVHRGGWTMSGKASKRRYFSGTGDPSAHYRFFKTISKRSREVVRSEVERTVFDRGVPREFFEWYIGVREHKWRLN